MNRGRWAARMDGVSKWLILSVVFLLAALLLTQAALQFPAVREWVTGVDRLEGHPFSEYK